MTATIHESWSKKERYRRRTGQFGNQPHTDAGLVDVSGVVPLPTGFDVVRASVMNLEDDTATYSAEDLETRVNFYDAPIVRPDRYRQIHQAADVPTDTTMPSVCSCGWTREQVDGVWVELATHIGNMGPYGLGVPWTETAKQKWPPADYDTLADRFTWSGLRRPYESMGHERRWRVGAFVEALPQLDDDEFRRAIRPSLEAHILKSSHDDAHLVLNDAFRADGARRSRINGHLWACYTGNPHSQVVQSICDDDGGVQSSREMCGCPLA